MSAPTETGLWRCPQCGTAQASAPRCWLCTRSATSCSSCRHFRPSVASGMGFCGIERHRSPLKGDEVRGCWEAGADELPSGPGTLLELVEMGGVTPRATSELVRRR